MCFLDFQTDLNILYLSELESPQCLNSCKEYYIYVYLDQPFALSPVYRASGDPESWGVRHLRIQAVWSAWCFVSYYTLMVWEWSNFSLFCLFYFFIIFIMLQFLHGWLPAVRRGASLYSSKSYENGACVDINDNQIMNGRNSPKLRNGVAPNAVHHS